MNESALAKYDKSAELQSVFLRYQLPHKNAVLASNFAALFPAFSFGTQTISYLLRAFTDDEFLTLEQFTALDNYLTAIINIFAQEAESQDAPLSQEYLFKMIKKMGFACADNLILHLFSQFKYNEQLFFNEYVLICTFLLLCRKLMCKFDSGYKGWLTLDYSQLCNLCFWII